MKKITEQYKDEILEKLINKLSKSFKIEKIEFIESKEFKEFNSQYLVYGLYLYGMNLQNRIVYDIKDNVIEISFHPQTLLK